MSTTLIGNLLDAAWDYPRLYHPASALEYLQILGQLSIDENISIQAAARLSLVNHLRLSRKSPKEINFDDENDFDACEMEDIPTYREIVRAIIGSKPPEPLTQFEATSRPDLIISNDQGRPQAVPEIGYGFAPMYASEAMDRLLHFAWASGAAGYHQSSVRMVGYLVIHELNVGDMIRVTERSIEQWIEETYGPFKGLDRFGVPMMPRLTRTICLPSHGARISAINRSDRPTGYVAFCISYEATGF